VRVASLVAASDMIGIDALRVRDGAGIALTLPVEFTPASNPADLNGDGVVAAGDLAILLGAWGACKSCSADLDGDGQVGASDLSVLLGAWGS
jgi:hypothetical protein